MTEVFDTPQAQSRKVECGTLTPKQCEVLDLLVQYKTSKEISRILKISPHTVDQRIESAKRNQRCNSRGALAMLYNQFRSTPEQLTHEESYVAKPTISERFELQDDPEQLLILKHPNWINQPEPKEKAAGYRVVPELSLSLTDTQSRFLAISGIVAFLAVGLLGVMSIFSMLANLAVR